MAPAKACFEAVRARPEQIYRGQLARLGALLRTLGPADRPRAAIHLWARFYLGEDQVNKLQHAARQRARQLDRRDAQQWLNRYWYLAADDTDTALLLLRFDLSLAQSIAKASATNRT